MKQIFIIQQLFEEQTGTSEKGQWRSRDFIVKEKADVQYPDEMVMTCRGGAVDQLGGVKVGDEVELSWNSSVRRFQRKDGTAGYSQQNNCWKVTNVTAL